MLCIVSLQLCVPSEFEIRAGISALFSTSRIFLTGFLSLIAANSICCMILDICCHSFNLGCERVGHQPPCPMHSYRKCDTVQIPSRVRRSARPRIRQLLCPSGYLFSWQPGLEKNPFQAVAGNWSRTTVTFRPPKRAIVMGD